MENHKNKMSEENVETIFKGELKPAQMNRLSRDSFQTALNDFIKVSNDGNVLEQIFYLMHEGILTFSPTTKEIIINDFERLKKYFTELYEHNHD